MLLHFNLLFQFHTTFHLIDELMCSL